MNLGAWAHTNHPRTGTTPYRTDLDQHRRVLAGRAAHDDRVDPARRRSTDGCSLILDALAKHDGERDMDESAWCSPALIPETRLKEAHCDMTTSYRAGPAAADDVGVDAHAAMAAYAMTLVQKQPAARLAGRMGCRWSSTHTTALDRLDRTRTRW